MDKENRAGFLQLYTWGMKRIMEKHLKAVDLVDEVVAKRKALLASRLPNLPNWPELGDIPQDRVDDLSKELAPNPDNEPVTHWATDRQSGGDRKMRPPRRQNGCDWKGKLRRRLPWRQSGCDWKRRLPRRRSGCEWRRRPRRRQHLGRAPSLARRAVARTHITTQYNGNTTQHNTQRKHKTTT